MPESRLPRKDEKSPFPRGFPNSGWRELSRRVVGVPVSTISGSSWPDWSRKVRINQFPRPASGFIDTDGSSCERREFSVAQEQSKNSPRNVIATLYRKSVFML